MPDSPMMDSPEAPTRVLVHLWGEHFPTPAIRERFPTVEFIPVHTDGPVAEDVSGDVCITQAARTENLEEVLQRGVQWVQALGQGVDHFPFEYLGDRTLTCARGVNAVPIAEWVVAMLLWKAPRSAWWGSVRSIRRSPSGSQRSAAGWWP